MDILVAEDDPCSAAVLGRLLERSGHRVTIAPDGEAAWRLASKGLFPVIISDWVMPGLDGPGLCRRVREQASRDYTYVILLTGKLGQKQRIEGLRAGADDFLVKPTDPEELTVRLEIARRIIGVQEELARRNTQLAELVAFDELTGVKTRRVFRELVASEAARADRREAPLSLVMIDVDHFKDYNDTFGHPAGDVALQTVATTLLDWIRKDDEVGRLGGEEFAILLPDTQAEVALKLVHRLRKWLALRVWPLRPLTASFGVATAAGPRPVPSELFEQADRALYRSKQRGRDCVTHFLDL